MSPRDWRPALVKANQTRARRHHLHEQVRASHDGRTSRILVARLLITPHPELNSMRALDLLGWAWGMYDTTAERMLTVAGASLQVTVGHLTVRQRILLARLLRADEHALRDAEVAELERWSRRPDA